MNQSYWTDFWNQHGTATEQSHPQFQVCRTLNQQPIGATQWRDTVACLIARLNLKPPHQVLDLCGGNGLIAKEIVKHCARVVVVDISEDLLRTIKPSSGKIDVIKSDMRTIEFAENSFDRIVWYAAIQYLTLAETVRVMRKLYRWLVPQGMLLIGDIPDAARQWNFFDSPNRRSAYFDQLAAGRPIVGTWYDQNWLKSLAEDVGFSHVETHAQPEEQIYSWFRFDLGCCK